MNYENEIEVLESALRNLEMAIGEIADTPYHSYLASTWEMDAEEINNRLDELYELQNEEWAKETSQQHFEYEMGVL